MVKVNIIWNVLFAGKIPVREGSLQIWTAITLHATGCNVALNLHLNAVVWFSVRAVFFSLLVLVTTYQRYVVFGLSSTRNSCFCVTSLLVPALPCVSTCQHLDETLCLTPKKWPSFQLQTLATVKIFDVTSDKLKVIRICYENQAHN